MNSNNGGSADNVHIHCLFEAQDSVENMQKFWHPYHHQIKQMYDKDYTICGKGGKVFLGGDYHFSYDQLGHQGASASFPSAFDKVKQSHLQNHADQPHVPSTRPVEKRSIDDYIANFNENLADILNNGNMQENGKYHYSVIGPMILPLIYMEQVVPAVLHILFGVVRLYNLLLDKCQQIDNDTGGHKIIEE